MVENKRTAARDVVGKLMMRSMTEKTYSKSTYSEPRGSPTVLIQAPNTFVVVNLVVASLLPGAFLTVYQSA